MRDLFFGEEFSLIVILRTSKGNHRDVLKYETCFQLIKHILSSVKKNLSRALTFCRLTPEGGTLNGIQLYWALDEIPFPEMAIKVFAHMLRYASKMR